jgi:L-lactate dehydrogenase complex protein LldG
MSPGMEINEILNDEERRSSFLSSVRQALGHSVNAASPAPDTRPILSERLLRQVEADSPQIISRWIEKARGNGMTVVEASVDGAATPAIEFLTSHRARTVMVNFSANPAPGIEGKLAAAGYTLRHWGDSDCMQQAFNCDASITDCRYGMADSGGFLVWSDRNFGRSTTLTTAVHIVLLPKRLIVADLIDAMPKILSDNNGLMPSNAVVINGPSKTGDIEMKLVTGVHGPKYLCAILLGD